MIDDLLYSMPLAALFALIVVLFLTFASLSLLLMQPLKMKYGHIEDGPGLTATSKAVATIFAVLGAFMAIGTLNSYNMGKDIVQQEAGLLDVMLNEVARLPGPVRKPVTDSLRSYMKSVVDEEWPAMKAGKAAGQAETYLQSTYTELATDPSNNPAQAKALERFNGHLDDLVLVHQKRISKASDGFPRVALVVVIICGMLVIITALFSTMKSRLIEWLAIHTVALAVALLISLVVGFDLPFRGTVSVSCDPIAMQLDRTNTKVDVVSTR